MHGAFAFAGSGGGGVDEALEDRPADWERARALAFALDFGPGLAGCVPFGVLECEKSQSLPFLQPSGVQWNLHGVSFFASRLRSYAKSLR